MKPKIRTYLGKLKRGLKEIDKLNNKDFAQETMKYIAIFGT